MRACIAGLGVTLALGAALALGACRARLADVMPDQLDAGAGSTSAAPKPKAATYGPGAQPGGATKPGGFVPRGSMRNFYAGARGRLWYYMNNYYWVPPKSPPRGLWIKADVIEKFSDLRTWPDGKAVTGPAPKTTVEYWEVGKSGRTVWVDNHKDFLLLADHYTAGAISVDVTLTLGRLMVKNKKEHWAYPEEPYILEDRNYRKDRGIGAARTRFEPLATEAITVWSYTVPWNTHPQRLTRSNWKRMKLPSWKLVARTPPRPAPARPATPVTSVSPGPSSGP